MAPVSIEGFHTIRHHPMIRHPRCPCTNSHKPLPPPPQSGLFGLGGPEVAIIAVAAAFLLGPQKLAEFSKDLGKVAGELKEVPKEFSKGIKEGEKVRESQESPFP